MEKLNNHIETHPDNKIKDNNISIIEKEQQQDNDNDRKDTGIEDKDDEEQEEDGKSLCRRVGDTVFYQCKQCPLMSLSRKAVSCHWSKEHSPKILSCPGCGIAFLSQILLKTHLSQHHQMTKLHSDTLVKNLLKELETSPDTRQRRTSQTVESVIETKNLIPLDLSKNLTLVKRTALSPYIVNLQPILISDSNEITGSESKPIIIHIDDSNNVTFEEESTEVRLVKNVSDSKNITREISKESSFDSRGFKCDIFNCNTRLKDLKKMEYHRTCHIEGGKDLACPECLRPFLTAIALHAHLWLDHRVDLELHSCDQCDYKTSSLSSLENVHKKIHSIEKKFQCLVCHKSFKNNKQLNRHKVLHKNDKNVQKFVCEICNNSLSTRSKLSRHIEAVHHKLKPFNCSLCKYSAANNWSLRLHMRTHSGEQTYRCTECPFKTSLAESLKRHIQTHSDEKRYSCKLCPYTCIQATTLRQHLKAKHPDAKSPETYSCEQCTFSTLNQTKYLTHVSTHTENLKISNEDSGNSTRTEDPPTDQQSYKIAVADHDKLIDKSLVTELLNFRHPFDYAISRSDSASTPDENSFNCEIQQENICEEVYSSNQSLNSLPSDSTPYVTIEDPNNSNGDIYSTRNYVINNVSQTISTINSPMNILNKVLLRPTSYESETTNMSEPQHSSSPIIIDGDSIRLNSPIYVESTQVDVNIATNHNFISSKSSSPLLPLTVQQNNQTDMGVVRKKPKISVKSNLLLKGPDNVNPFHPQVTCKAITSLLSLRNQTPPKDSSSSQCDKSGSINLTLKPTNELTSQDNSSTFLQNGSMILPNFPFSSNYGFGDELFDDINLPTDIEPPFISNESLESQNNMISGLMMPSPSNMKLENKHYMNGHPVNHLIIQNRYPENMLSNELPDLRLPVQIPMKYENKLHTLPQQSIQDFFFDNINSSSMENISTIEELPPSFENNTDNVQMYNSFYNNDVSSDAGDERKIIIVDETSCDMKSSSLTNFESKAGLSFENKVFNPTNSNPWKQNLMLPSFIRLSNEIDSNNSHNTQGINLTGDVTPGDQYENQTYTEVFGS